MWEAALSEALDDWRLHLVFSDYCEENGLPGRADFHRHFASVKRAEQRQQALRGSKRQVCKVYNQRVVGSLWCWYAGWDSNWSTHRGWINEKMAALLMDATLASSAPLEV